MRINLCIKEIGPFRFIVIIFFGIFVGILYFCWVVNMFEVVDTTFFFLFPSEVFFFYFDAFRMTS